MFDKSIIRQTIEQTQLTQVLTDAAESSIDVLCEQPEILEGIPLVNSAFAVANSIRTYQSIVLTKKLAKLLVPIAEIDLLDRTLMIQKMEESRDFSERVGDHYMLLLERADSMRKPAIYGIVFQQYCRERIALEFLPLINNAIDRLPIDLFSYLDSFAKIYHRPDYQASFNERSIPRRAMPDDITSTIVTSGFGYFWSGLSVPSAPAPNPLCLLFVKEVLPLIGIDSRPVDDFDTQSGGVAEQCNL